ncbi:MAG: Type 1 glutamine amidotransferase-like domain-containing protein [Candidatus Moraniibacteriota bacterium]
MKMELFLTSSVHAVARDIAEKVDLTQANRLVFIDTAAEPKGEREDLEWLKNDRQALVDAGFVVSDYTITGKSRSQLEIDLDAFDYLYLSGGNASYLLEQSQKSGFITLIKELVSVKGKIYIGTSAGSIIAGPKLPDYFREEEVTLKNRNTYGLVNFTIVPHWGSLDFKEKYLGERMKSVYKEDQVPLVLLTDNQYVHVQNDHMKIIDVKD